MRELINKIIMLESANNDIPQIANYLQDYSKSIVELYYNKGDINKIVDNFHFDSKEYLLKRVVVSMPFGKNNLGHLEFFDNPDDLRFTIYFDNVFTSSNPKFYTHKYQPIIDLTKLIFSDIGFKKDVFGGVLIKNIDYNSFNCWLPHTEELLKAVNIAYKYRQEIDEDL